MCLIHGDADYVVPVDYLDISVKFLMENGVNAEGHSIRSLKHTINDEGIKLGAEFIKKNFLQLE